MTQQEFDEIANEWEISCGPASFWHMMRKKPNAQKIVEMGEEAIPFILKRLRRDKWIGWSQILCEITKTHPNYQPDKVAPGFVGIDVHAFGNAWLDWGHEKGYLKKGPPD